MKVSCSSEEGGGVVGAGGILFRDVDPFALRTYIQFELKLLD